MKNKLIKTSTMAAAIVAVSFTLAASTASAHYKCRYIKQPGVTIKVCDKKGHYHDKVFGATANYMRSVLRGIGGSLSKNAGKQ